MPGPCYKIGDDEAANHARRQAETLLRSFPGFLGWTPFTGWHDPNARVDLVAWADLDSAQAAARAVGTASEFAEFRSSVANLVSMSHYRAPHLEPRPVAVGAGLEIGRFRLRPGVEELNMRAAYNEMLASHLALQPGWRHQHLVRLKDGTFVDLAFAQDQARSEAISATWVGTPECDRFLALIEPESMEFGTLI
ncbi:hypothetical protein [Sphingomonas sanguinis]|mgnify:CR=1 FL=1|jgi:hypothetical protein|uniref:ABM domain-containing protein n=2 Tax=Sphingomonas sanguinis TaxID=33051 RepID=A0A7Y7QW16_9SPHN|nr:hypothetical protein [Sphingomonas sanguinis]MBZ6382389.1 hypothetical protein [Sphingomonas sanguinis]NNG50581.1 hypothetical protein [Sphingomonas sanguinis]NNG54659.1 hypothetical protein [Sphingomonas sanguinis]NVP31688.1 hypothetical protein [Sphingomonas sanguinis]